jgi:hypothetical protein
MAEAEGYESSKRVPIECDVSEYEQAKGVGESALERQLLHCPNQLGLTLQSTRGHVGIYESETMKRSWE